MLRAVSDGALKLKAGEAGTRLLNAGESQIVARALARFSRVERVGSDISIPSVSNELDLSEPWEAQAVPALKNVLSICFYYTNFYTRSKEPLIRQNCDA